MNKILIVNRSTAVSDEAVRLVMPAFQAFVSSDLVSAWGQEYDAQLAYVGISEDVPAGEWSLFLYDHTDQVGAGGYHLDTDGKVFGRVFVKDAMQANEAWTVDATHELAEMIVDPTAGTDPSRYVRLQGEWAGKQCLPEVCDACEDDSFAYERPGADGEPVMLTDFVTPGYFFLPDQPGRFDFRGHLEAPAPALLIDGYLGIYDPLSGEWSQVSNFRLNGKPSRRHLRMGRTRFAATGK